MEANRLTPLVLILPGAGFIFVFLAAALGMTALQSVGLYSLVGESRLTADHWKSLYDKAFFDSFLFSFKVGIASFVRHLAVCISIRSPCSCGTAAFARRYSIR